MTITHSSSLISITFTICTVSIYVCFGFFCLFICGQSSTIFSCALLKMKIKTIEFITFSCFVHTTDTYSQQKQQTKWKKNRVKILYWKIQVKIHNILYGICQFVLLVWSKNRKKIVPSLSFDRSFQKDHFKKKKKWRKKTPNRSNTVTDQVHYYKQCPFRQERPIPDIPIFFSCS